MLKKENTYILFSPSSILTQGTGFDFFFLLTFLTIYSSYFPVLYTPQSQSKFLSFEREKTLFKDFIPTAEQKHKGHFDSRYWNTVCID